MGILANLAIPTVAGHVFVMVILLIPIALIEAIVLSRRHALPCDESARLSLWANLKSTVIGLPMGYFFAWLGIVPAGFFAGMLPEPIRRPIHIILSNALLTGGMQPMDEHVEEMAFCLGTLLVMIPYFLVTLHVERKVIAKRRPDLNTPALRTTVRIMNDITYGLLVVLVVIGAIQAWIKLAATG